MNSKERILLALNHKEPDRVPIAASFTSEFAQRLQKYLGLPQTSIKPHDKRINHDIEVTLGLDIIQYSVGIVTSYYASEEDEYTCEWGIKWRQAKYNTRFGEGKYPEMIEHPLSDDYKIKKYISPDPHREELYKPLEHVLDIYGKEFCIMGVVVCTVFEGGWYLRGMEKLLIDMLINEEIANFILDIPFKYHLEVAKRLVQMGIDIIWLGDDVGSQRTMLMSPKLWRKYLKPRMSIICQELKKINPSLKIAYHSDGYIYPIIDELIEIGIDILNPIQPQSMDPLHLKKRYGNKLSFWGSLDEQYTLPFGTSEEVKKEVIERIKTIAPGGGFIISPCQHVQLDTPLENFMTFINTVKEYGKYPVRL